MNKDDALLATIKMKDRLAEEFKEEKKDSIPSTPFMIELNKPNQGNMNPSYLKKENIDRWNTMIEMDREYIEKE
jgi:hypothetical protein